MFSPDCPYLFIGRKFATRGGSFRSGDSGLFFGRELHRRLIVSTHQAENHMGDIVLRFRRKVACRFNGLVEKSLVLAEAGDGIAERYRLLETLRQYGSERLASAYGVAPQCRYAR